jgi:hypothetical protein
MTNLQDDDFFGAMYPDLLDPEGNRIEAEGKAFGLDDQVEYEDLSSDEIIVAPFDPTQIRVETRVMSIDLLLARIREGEMDMAPDFQRQAGIWKDDAKSRLIESILIRIPLPAFYMDATDDDRWIVVDGLQRLTALNRFILDKSLKLQGLEFLKPIEGLDYDKLPRNFQRRILETQITVYLIARGTPPEVKFNIFKRINTGGLPLSSQEIRHALNQGPVTALLTRLADSKAFKQATAGSVSNSRMADREFVLRYLAFLLIPYTEYVKPDFDEFLNRAMHMINEMSEKDIAHLERQFTRTMEAAAAIFGNDAFRKRYKPNAGRALINKPLFETWSVNLSQRSDAELKKLQSRQKTLQRKFIDLLNNERDFDKAISQGTGDVSKVKLRFSRIQQLIEEVLT